MTNTIQLLANYGAWNETSNYGQSAISGMSVSTPLVSYDNVLYILNNTINPTIGLAPNLDTAWDPYGSATIASYAIISGFLANTPISSGVISLSGSTVDASNDISLSGNNVLMPNKRCMVTVTLIISTNSSGGGYITISGSNISVTTNLMILNTNASYSTRIVSAIVTPIGANPSINLTASSIVGNVTLPLAGTIQIQSIV